MGLLPRMIPDEKYISQQKALQAGSLIEQIPVWWHDKPAYPLINFESNVRFGYRANELIFACMGTKANTAASAHLRVIDDEGEPLEDHPLQLIINQPNKFYTETDMIGMIIMHLDLAGRSYWQKLRTRGGKVIELWPLRPDWTKPIRSRTDFISGYEYRVPGLDVQRINAGDILDFRLADPLDFFNGYSPVSTAMRVAHVDNAVTDYLELFFKNGGIPPGLLTTKSRLNDEDVTDIRRRWQERYGGIANWLAPAVIDQDVTYQKTGLDFKEMGMEALDGRTESRICSILGVPAILVGAQVGIAHSHLSNMQEAQTDLWHNTLMPLYKRIADEIATDLVREFQGDIDVEWDFSDVAALNESTDQIWSRAQAALTAGGITRNEFRDMVGYEPDPAGDIYYVSNSVTVTPADKSAEEIAEEAAAQTEAIVGAQGDQNGDQNEPAVAEGTEEPGQAFIQDTGNTRARLRGHSGRKAKPKPRGYRTRINRERAMELALNKFFTNQLDRVMKEVTRE